MSVGRDTRRGLRGGGRVEEIEVRAYFLLQASRIAGVGEYMLSYVPESL